MKKKLKKLSLNTETLRTLSHRSLEDAAGAISTTPDCDSLATRICSLCTIACSACCP
jgi:hypothetical protein